LVALLLFMVFLAAGMPTAPAQAAPAANRPMATGAAGSTLTIGIKPLEPFVEKDATGTFTGFSIDLWNDIARRNSWKTTYVWYDDIKWAESISHGDT
jgi:polar amino acid transport system substrate-binding protein